MLDRFADDHFARVRVADAFLKDADARVSRGEAFARQVHGQHIRAFLGEELRGGLSDAGGGAGHDGGAVFETHGILPNALGTLPCIAGWENAGWPSGCAREGLGGLMTPDTAVHKPTGTRTVSRPDAAV